MATQTDWVLAAIEQLLPPGLGLTRQRVDEIVAELNLGSPSQAMNTYETS